MENKQLIDNALIAIYNIKADVILGKNLKMHLIDIGAALAKLEFNIRIAKMNNEPTIKRQEFLYELIKLGNEILDEIKKSDNRV